MSRSLFPLAVFALVVAALGATVLFAQQIGGARAQSAVVNTVAIDLDPTGNTATGIGADTPNIEPGDIQSERTVPEGAQFAVDIVVNSVPLIDGRIGLFGVGGELHYNPSVLEIAAVGPGDSSLLQFQGTVNPFHLTDAIPDTNGVFRFDSVDLSGNEEYGPGRVLTITLRCKAFGTSGLAITDSSFSVTNHLGIGGDSGAVIYDVTNEIEATVNCTGHGVDSVALDLDPTGNTATNIGGGGPGIDSGDIQSAVGDIPVGESLTVDLVVDAVPSDPGDGLFGLGGELTYDPDVVELVGVTTTDLLHYSAGAPVPYNSTDALPDADGSFRFYSIDTSNIDETGPGRLFSFTVRCVAQGESTLALSDNVTGGGQSIGLFGPGAGIRYDIINEFEGLVACGRALSTPAPTASSSPSPSPGPMLEVRWGDSNCKDGVDPFDAYLVLGYDAGLPVNILDCPGMGSTVGVEGVPTLWPDTDCAGTVDPIDALKILRSDVGLPVSQNEPCPDVGDVVDVEARSVGSPTPVTSPTPTTSPTVAPTPVGTLTVGSAAAAPNSTVTTEVSVDATGLASYRVDVQYDASLVTPVSCTSDEGVCSINLVGPNTVRLNGTNINNDIIGRIGTIEFATGNFAGVAALNVDPATLLTLTSEGEPAPLTVMNGAITIEGPTPGPLPSGATPLPTPSGPALAIGSATVEPGSQVTIPITADVTSLVAYRVDVAYDGSLVSAIGCSLFHGVCSVNVIGPNTVRVSGTSLSAISGLDSLLGTITVEAGSAAGVAALVIDASTLRLYNPNGEQIPLPIIDGAITIATPTPVPTPSPSPTPAPTASPTPTPPPPTPLPAFCDGKPATHVGTNGPDIIVGTNRADVIVTGGGNDVIQGLGGRDLICAGDGNDTVVGGDGRDRIFGEGGFDTLFGEDGRDHLDGGPSFDICEGGRDTDTFASCEFVEVQPPRRGGDDDDDDDD